MRIVRGMLALGGVALMGLILATPNGRFGLGSGVAILPVDAGPISRGHENG